MDLTKKQQSIRANGEVRNVHRAWPGWITASACVALVAVMTGCAVTPKPLTPDEVARRVADDRAKMYAGQEPIRGPLSLSEAGARAIMYNLDYRLKVMEEALAQGTLDATKWDMFPRLLANAGYVNRSNDLAYVTANGVPSTTTLERNRKLASIEFSWNLLDFGVSYFRSKMAADQTLVIEERKRKVIQNLMQDVRIAYWRALGAQRLMGQLDSLMNQSRVALQRARAIEQQGLLPQAQALAYQRALLDSTVLLQSRRQDLEIAKTELASLMNLPPGTDYTLVDSADPQLPPMPANLDRLEEMALNLRPELREEDYRKRISSSDARRALVSALPGLSLDFSRQYDSNRYLLNNSWAEGGVRLSMNLFRLASIPTLNRQRDAQLQVDDTRRMAQAIAVLTQLRVAAQRYALAKDELDQVTESEAVDSRLANYAKAAASSRVDSELEVIRTEARSLLSAYQRHVAYANAQAAHGRLFNSLGFDVMPPVGQPTVAELSSAIERSMDEWYRSAFERPQRSAIEGLRLSLQVDGPTDAIRREAVVDGVKTALRRQGLEVVDAGPEVHRLIVQVTVASASHRPSRTRRELIPPSRANWTITLLRPNGTLLGSSRYTSSLASLEANPQALGLLTRSAIEMSSLALINWILPEGETRLTTLDRPAPDAIQ
jgi:outer membrane protein TolC